MSDRAKREGPAQAERRRQERGEFASYAAGLGGALTLTVSAFALIRWEVLPHFWLVVAIGALALVQGVVHFRFFLHIGFRQRREDLQLILFSALLLAVMVAGTVWIMASLATRMTMP
ncbi:MAG: cytochrome o ubiquinol oxidase subunit IV [Caulobacteraceae bacterium]